MGIFNFKDKAQKRNIIEYIPNIGFILNSKKIEWKSDRQVVRKELKLKFKDNDRTIDIAQFFNGDETKNIHQKRDVYENIFSKNDLLFLNYDKENKLRDLEVHYGFDIIIDKIQLDFETEISDFIRQFQSIGIEYSELKKGDYLLPKLKITIADSESMGGDGTKLSYFYATYDINHLIE